MASNMPPPVMRVTIKNVELKLTELVQAFSDGFDPASELGQIPPNALPGNFTLSISKSVLSYFLDINIAEAVIELGKAAGKTTITYFRVQISIESWKIIPKVIISRTLFVIDVDVFLYWE